MALIYAAVGRWVENVALNLTIMIQVQSSKKEYQQTGTFHHRISTSSSIRSCLIDIFCVKHDIGRLKDT